MSSRWERALVQNLMFAARDVNPGWPWPEPIAQHHPDWCCEHLKKDHSLFNSPPDGYCSKCPITNDDDYRFQHDYRKGRDWAIDAAYPDLKVAVEYEGIVWAKKGEQVGRHQTGAGMTADLEKYLWLQERGWTVIRVGQRDVSSGYALTVVQAALKSASTQPIVT